MNPHDRKTTLLKERFGHNAFRPLQEEAIDAILSGRDVLMVLPTGGGKSLSFQLPALMLEGCAVVISPLIALMQDQVQSLNAQEMNAAMLSSSQSAAENHEVINRLLSGELNFLYISPERLNTPNMQQILHQARISLFVIDEAHCISEWGHEFRDDYRSLSMLRALYPNVPIAAFTATATTNVRHDIVRLLDLHDPEVLHGEIYRPNLKITVEQRIKNGFGQLSEFLQERKGMSGVIYMSSRAKCEELSAHLNAHGFKADYYHAGMPTEQRDGVFQDFIYDRVDIIVATIAFGMGIDKSDIRFVVHMSMPKTIENYYQEIGRAGRDGDDAEVVMYAAGADMVYARMRFDEIENETYRRHLQEKLNTMHRYTSAEECRHQFIARYFESEIAPCGDRCDNCLAGEIEKSDITTDAQKLLSAVYRTGQRFGKGYVIDVLHGSSNQKVLANGHDELSVYGIGTELHKKQWLVIVDRLLETACLELGEYHVMSLTAKGIGVLKGEETIDIASDRLTLSRKTAKKASVTEGLDADAAALFESLRALRAELAEEAGVPAYVIFTDKALKSMAVIKPLDDEAFLEVNGVGPSKLEKFGKRFIDRIKEQ
jgi:ATP-dependent DNA helicase RecQ